ncbi:hypothetical protein BHM03_00031902 [Ensete ventricosum]|nr:hypothetical protein BHM03_00031902 [Ensete ventricosum]
MGEGAGFQLGTVGALSLSVVSSVSIVICNKALMSSLGFIFGMRSDYLYFAFLVSADVSNASDDKASNHSLYCLPGDCLFGEEVQVKDNDSEALMRAESGAGIDADGAAPTATVWSSNKDLRA